MDQDDHYIYCSEYGNNCFRVYEKMSLERRVVDVGLLTHHLLIFQNYIILMDTICLYIVEKKTYQVIASYNVNGEVTAICGRGKDSKTLLGITTKGQLFSINLELKDQNLR